jgi:hypothetical protein
MSSKFHIGDTVNFYPSRDDFEAETVIEEYLVRGFVPGSPPLTKDSKIIAIGPCFASAMGQHLLQQGYQVTNRRDRLSYIGRFGDKIGNSFAMRGQLEWAWGGVTPAEALWHGYDAERLPYDEPVRTRTKRLLDGADAFILTLHNAEIWQDDATGGVFWGAVPADQFDPERHRFRVSTYQENLANLMEIYRLIRRNRPQATIVMTLSALPAPATFRPVAALAAGMSSKSMLRSALDEFYRVVQPRDPHFHYFPSYDITRCAFDRPFSPDHRRIEPRIADFMMLLFEHYFGEPRIRHEDLLARFLAARGLHGRPAPAEPREAPRPAPRARRPAKPHRVAAQRAKRSDS